MKTRILSFTILFMILLSVSAFAVSNPSESPSPTPKPPPTPLGSLALYSTTAVLMDASTGQVLIERGMDEVMYPASTTKVMTALLALEFGNLTDVLTISQTCIDAVPRDSSHIALDVGEEITLEQALFGMMLASGNDAAYAIAEHIGGTEEHFAEMMNQKARELGCRHTNFVNPNGMPDPEHVTTAYDLALMLRAAIQNPDFVRISGTGQYKIPPTNKQREERVFNNTHGMIKPRPTANFPYEGVLAGKTGFTSVATNTLVTAAQRQGRTLIAAVMQSADSGDKYEDTIQLLDYGFSSFSQFVLDGASLPAFEQNVALGDGSLWRAEVSLSGTISLLMETSVIMPEILTECELTTDTQDGQSVPVRVHLPENDERMYPELGTLSGTVRLMEDITPVELPQADANEADASDPAVSASPAPDEQTGNSFWRVLRNILIGVAAVIALLFAALVIMRTINVRRYRRRHGRRRY